MSVTAYNAGDATARAITATLTLPERGTVAAASSAWSVLGDQQVTWTLGDFAPGQWKPFQVTFHVESVEGGETRRWCATCSASTTSTACSLTIIASRLSLGK